jgi:ketosteroid isomerase-like protein
LHPQLTIPLIPVRPMNETAFDQWLQAYGRAWENRDPLAAAELYTSDDTYQVTPFLEPRRGRQAILEYWMEVSRTEIEISFDYEVLTVTQRFGIARWHVSFVRTAPRSPYKTGWNFCN